MKPRVVHQPREARVLGGDALNQHTPRLRLPSADAARGDEVAAVVATREEVTVEQLRQFLHARLPDWQLPREWRLVESLAVNARGKLSRAEWRSEFRP